MSRTLRRVVVPLIALLLVGLMVATDVSAEGGTASAATPNLTLTPDRGPCGTDVTAQGTGFPAGIDVLIHTGSDNGPIVGRARVGPDGGFTAVLDTVGCTAAAPVANGTQLRVVATQDRPVAGDTPLRIYATYTIAGTTGAGTAGAGTAATATTGAGASGAASGSTATATTGTSGAVTAAAGAGSAAAANDDDDDEDTASGAGAGSATLPASGPSSGGGYGANGGADNGRIALLAGGLLLFALAGTGYGLRRRRA